MEIKFCASPSSADAALLFDGINEDNRQKGFSPVENFGFYLRDPQTDKNIGGLTGILLHGILYVEMLWVEKKSRGQGWGAKLMQSAERYAQEQRCTFATVNTMSWEALPFYQKLGYEIEFTRKGFAKNSSMYLLRKAL